MSIEILDQETINQIAAGEVVERPASVVKELMENAIDAGATAITVEIRQGGIGFIRITDNGCGIPMKEIPLAFLRHSTSKIRSAADLLTVSSLGFRGEALSSIAAVSQVELITKTAGSLTGARYRIEGGTEKGLEEVGAPDGTTFISRNLFYNTPARRKFLKTETTEGGHVADLVEKIALSHPEISIRLIVNNQSRLHTSGNHNLKDIIYTIYGREIAANLLETRGEADGIRISGFIGKPVIARGNRNYENYFINGRYIKSRLISKAIEDGYKSYMMQHKYPFTLLHFHVEPEFIDVNVHPSKMELRFKDGEGVYRAVYQAVTEALSGKELIPKAGLSESSGSGGKPASEVHAGRTEGKGSGSREHGPEPFETRRKEALGLLKEPQTAYQIQTGQSGNRLRDASVSGQKQESRQGPETMQSQGSLQPPEQKLPAEGSHSQAEHAGMTDERAKDGSHSRDEWQLPKENPTRESRNPESHPTAESHPKEGNLSMGDPSAPGTESRKTENGSYEQMELFDGRLLSREARSRHRLIGQVFDTYWLVEYNENLYIIDQHAAHEKVLFEQNFASLASREYTSQLISPPIILTLSISEAELLNAHMDIFRQVGFEIEPFGGSEYAVRGVPANLLSLAQKDLLMEMIDSLAEDGGTMTPESVYDRIATMSCKAAVKGNTRLSFQEADQLIDALLKLENPYTCPHGRPTIVSISKYEMEKKFKRIV